MHYLVDNWVIWNHDGKELCASRIFLTAPCLCVGVGKWMGQDEGLPWVFFPSELHKPHLNMSYHSVLMMICSANIQ